MSAPLLSDEILIQVEAAVCAEPEIAALDALAAGRAASSPKDLDLGEQSSASRFGWPFGPPSPGAVPPGGAAVGRVIATGEGAPHLAGRRVLAGPLDPCGDCEVCRRGLPFACAAGRFLGQSAPGALSGQVVVRARWVTELGGGLELDGPLAALIGREAADAYALYARAGLAAGEPAIVLGRGPVARLLAQIASARGARVVSVSAADPGGESLALERVAAHVAQHAAGRRPLKMFAVSCHAQALAGDEDDPGDELGLALRLATPGALIVALARPPLHAIAAAGGRAIAALLAGGGALVGVPAAHPDLIPEVAALAVKGELDLTAVVDVYTAEPGQSPLADPAALAARGRASLAAGRALVVVF